MANNTMSLTLTVTVHHISLSRQKIKSEIEYLIGKGGVVLKKWHEANNLITNRNCVSCNMKNIYSNNLFNLVLSQQAKSFSKEKFIMSLLHRKLNHHVHYRNVSCDSPQLWASQIPKSRGPHYMKRNDMMSVSMLK